MRDGECTIFWRVGILALVALAGCGTPESVRETNYLNGEAAKWIVGASEDPAIDRAAKSIADGSTLIARKIGDPEVQPVYTPETHEATIVQGNKDVDAQEAVKKGIGGFFQNLVTKGADLLIPGAGGFLMAAFFWVRKTLAFDKLKKGAAVVVNTLEAHPEIKAKVADKAAKLGLGQVVDGVVQALKK